MRSMQHARISIQSGGQVNAQQRRGLLVQGIQQVGQAACGRTRGANAKQSVDAQVLLTQVRRRCIRKADAGIHRALP